MGDDLFKKGLIVSYLRRKGWVGKGGEGKIGEGKESKLK